MARNWQRQAQAKNNLAMAREMLSEARSSASGSAEQIQLLADAARLNDESIGTLEGQSADSAVIAKVQRARIDLESGEAFAALTDLIVLSDLDRPTVDSPWTSNTAVIESAIAETRYKIALMCRSEGDGYENWSKYVEAAALSYKELSDRNPTEREKDDYVKNLAVCTRLLHGRDEDSHSLGLPALPTPNCAKQAREWTRPPPQGGGGSGGKSDDNKEKNEPWVKPPESDETTQGG